MRRLFTFLLSVTAGITLAQIPNPGFESWDSSAGYRVPVGWDNMNPATSSTSVLTCQRVETGYTGAYYLGLNTQSVPGMGIVSGTAVSGKLDYTTNLPKSGFPYTSRPQVLAGFWQYMAYTTADQGFVEIFLSKWNSIAGQRDTVAYTHYLLPDMVMSWESFMIPLDYHSTANPDSAIVFLSASGPTPVAYSFIWVDDLRFGDSATLNTGHFSKPDNGVRVFPNPSAGVINLQYDSHAQTNIQVSVADITGRTVYSTTVGVKMGRNEIPLNDARFPKGFYFVNTRDESGTKTEKLIVE